MALLVGLHVWLECVSGLVRAMIERYYTKLDARIRTWPRTAENDPFHAASQDLAAQLSQETGCEVIVGYNEFCAPDLTRRSTKLQHKGQCGSSSSRR